MAQISDIGIDLGTSNVLIYMKGKGIVLREPAVVAIDRDTRNAFAVGNDAYLMIGRTPGSVMAIRPLRNGSVVDFDLLKVMITYFLNKVVGKHFFTHPRAVVSVPTGVNDVEKRSITSVMLDAGIKRVHLVSRPIAAALGFGLGIDDPYGTMVVDMGAGATDIAVLASGQVAVAGYDTIGGDMFDDAIIRYLRKKNNLLIGERTAEELKIHIGSAYPRQDEVAMDVTGRDVISGLPKTMNVTSTEIYEALREPVSKLIESIQSIIERTPPQLANDVFEDGIVLTGGAASLTGLCEALYEVLHVPCGVADDPQTSIVMGCGAIVNDLSNMKHLLGENRRFFR